MRILLTEVDCGLSAETFWAMKMDMECERYVAACDNATVKVVEEQCTEETMTRTIRLIFASNPVPAPLRRLVPAGDVEPQVTSTWSPRYYDEAHPKRTEVHLPGLGDRVSVRAMQWVVPVSDTACKVMTRLEVQANIFGMGGMVERAIEQENKAAHEALPKRVEHYVKMKADAQAEEASHSASASGRSMAEVGDSGCLQGAAAAKRRGGRARGIIERNESFSSARESGSDEFFSADEYESDSGHTSQHGEGSCYSRPLSRASSADSWSSPRFLRRSSSATVLSAAVMVARISRSASVESALSTRDAEPGDGTLDALLSEALGEEAGHARPVQGETFAEAARITSRSEEGAEAAGRAGSGWTAKRTSWTTCCKRLEHRICDQLRRLLRCSHCCSPARALQQQYIEVALMSPTEQEPNSPSHGPSTPKALGV